MQWVPVTFQALLKKFTAVSKATDVSALIHFASSERFPFRGNRLEQKMRSPTSILFHPIAHCILAFILTVFYSSRDLILCIIFPFVFHGLFVAFINIGHFIILELLLDSCDSIFAYFFSSLTGMLDIFSGPLPDCPASLRPLHIEIHWDPYLV